MNIISYFRNAFVILLAVFVTSCKDDDKKKNQPPFGSGANDVADATGHFGLDVLKAIHANEPGETVLISPLSIQTAFNMALEGAKESTYDQITATMHLPTFDLETIRKESGETADVLVNKSGHPSVTIANAFFYDPGRLSPNQDFLDALGNYYEAYIASDNFGQQAAVDNINQWVDDKTKGLIEEIIEDISPEEIAFIINALHFKSDWATGFHEAQTNTGDYTKSDGSKISIDFMSGDQLFTSALTNNWQMVDLPFKDSTFSLTLVRPTNGQQTNWLQSFTMADLNNLYDELKLQRLYLRLPVMELEFEYELSEPLKALGMTNAFSAPQANFTGIGTPLIGPNIFITRVDHKTVLKVDEKGAEGAAVTSIGVGVLSMPPSVTFNIPYLLSLRHIPSGAVLFMGFIEDPVN
ncbi:MAG: hypothetical protein JJU02_01755 [Cryomorphaceae bacterium]|nr:hypothetical protein [Cryomorphaceae bacterium]